MCGWVVARMGLPVLQMQGDLGPLSKTKEGGFSESRDFVSRYLFFSASIDMGRVWRTLSYNFITTCNFYGMLVPF